MLQKLIDKMWVIKWLKRMRQRHAIGFFSFNHRRGANRIGGDQKSGFWHGVGKRFSKADGGNGFANTDRMNPDCTFYVLIKLGLAKPVMMVAGNFLAAPYTHAQNERDKWAQQMPNQII